VSKKKVHISNYGITVCGLMMKTGLRILIGVGDAHNHPDACKRCLRKKGKK